MNKKIWLFLLFFVLAVGMVFAIGLSRKGKSPVSQSENTENGGTTQNASSSVAAGSATDADADNPDAMEERDEEQEYFDQVAENEEKIEEEGNIFPRDSYQKFDGFGFRIEEFQLFDTYDEYINSDYYTPDNDKYVDPNHPEESADMDEARKQPHKIAYVKFTVTNEDRYDKEFLLGNANIVYAVDGVLYGVGLLESVIFFERDITLSRVANWTELDNEKDWYYFPLDPGESVTLELAKFYQVGYYDEETDTHTAAEFDAAVNGPTWYLKIIGNMYSTPDGVYEIEKNTDSIFIECE